MKRISSLFLILIMVAFVCTELKAQGGVNQTCVAACKEKDQACYNKALGVYVTCGQQGGSEEECRLKRLKAYDECSAATGCRVCYACGDWRVGLLGQAYYCICGNPYYCGDETTDCGLTFDGGYSNPCDCNPDDPTCTSPVILDLAGNGFHLTNVALGVKFNLRLTGPIQTAWTQPNSDDAWLALDRNGNGTIDSGGELFGNLTAQPERPEKNGFHALAEFDKAVNGGNGDGLITSADVIFSSLRLWQDKNHNGMSEPDELKALPAFSIESIALDFSESRRMDPFGNLFRYRAKVNGVRFAYDVFLTHEQQRK